MNLKPQTVFIAAIALIVGVVGGVVIVETHQDGARVVSVREEAPTIPLDATTSSVHSFGKGDEGYRFSPLIERVTTSTYVAVFAVEGSYFYGVSNAVVYSINPDNRESRIVDSYIQGQQPLTVSTSKASGVFLQHFRLGLGSVMDHYSLQDGHHILSIFDHGDTIQAKKGDRVIEVSLENECTSYDKPTAITGLVVNGKTTSFAATKNIQCEDLGMYTKGPLVTIGDETYDPVTDSISFHMPTGDSISISLRSETFGNVDIKEIK